MHRRSTASAVVSSALRGTDAATPATISGQLPGGLLLAAYAAVFVIAGIFVMQRTRRHRLMRLRPATAADAAVATDLIIAVDIDQVGEADYSHEDAAGRVERGRLRARPGRGGGRGRRRAPRSPTRTSAAATCSPSSTREREGEGAGTALLEWAERRGREKGLRTLRQAVGDRGTSARALLEAAGWQPRAQLLADGARRRPRATRSRPACAPSRPHDAPALHAIHEAAFSRVGGYDAAHEDAWIQREFDAHGFDAALSRVAERDGAPVGSRSPAAGRTTSSTSRCSRSTPTPPAAASAARC